MATYKFWAVPIYCSPWVPSYFGFGFWSCHWSPSLRRLFPRLPWSLWRSWGSYLRTVSCWKIWNCCCGMGIGGWCWWWDCLIIRGFRGPQVLLAKLCRVKGFEPLLAYKIVRRALNHADLWGRRAWHSWIRYCSFVTDHLRYSLGLDKPLNIRHCVGGWWGPTWFEWGLKQLRLLALCHRLYMAHASVQLTDLFCLGRC